MSQVSEQREICAFENKKDSYVAAEMIGEVAISEAGTRKAGDHTGPCDFWIPS